MDLIGDSRKDIAFFLILARSRRLAHRLARREDVVRRHGRVVAARLREEVPAEERARRRLEEVPALPAVGDVRRREPVHDVLAEGELLAVEQAARGAVGHVVGGEVAHEDAAHGLGLGRDLQDTAPPE